VNIWNLIIQRKRGNGSKKTVKIGKVTSHTAQSVKDENGNLVSTTEEQLNVCRPRYEKLASDSTGNSSNLEFWYQPPIDKRLSPTWGMGYQSRN